MDHMLQSLSKVLQTSARNDDDLIDRLNHRYTSLILIVFTIIISTTQYVGTPIHCWCPAHYTANHEKYSNYVCWISKTYYLLDQKSLPGPTALKKHIGYYQWVPVALLLQALFFFLPCLFWRLLGDSQTANNPRSGINVNNLVEAAETIQNALYPERREKTIRYMIRHLDHYLDYQREYRGDCCDGCKQGLANISSTLVCGNRRGNYLVALYLCTKLIYMTNSLGQVFLLNFFLGADYHMYGVQVAWAMFQGREWKSDDSNRFPRLTLCDFKIFQMGNVQPVTLQCVLPINFFSEKIYLFLWFWMLFVSVLTFVSLLRWIYVLCIGNSRTKYVRKHLKIMDRLKLDCDRDRKLSYKFSEQYLRQDGVFVLKLVAKNSTDLVVADIFAALWDHYKTKPRDLLGHQRSQVLAYDPPYPPVISQPGKPPVDEVHESAD